VGQQIKADACLILVTLIWGSTFVLVKRTVEGIPVFAFLCLRFLLASAVLIAMFGRRLLRLRARDILSGALIGLALFAGYALQTIGLQYTTASKAGFITGLSVVIVPLISTVLLKTKVRSTVLAGVALSTVGLGLLTVQHDLLPSYGDLIVLGCAVAFALHIVLVSIFAPTVDAMALTTVQIATVALLSGLVSLSSGIWWQQISSDAWMAAGFTGVFATAFAFGVQNAVQSHTTATHTALIFAAEPVFAALSAYLLAGEVLAGWGVVGCGLILMGMILAEIPVSAFVRKPSVKIGKESR